MPDIFLYCFFFGIKATMSIAHWFLSKLLLKFKWMSMGGGGSLRLICSFGQWYHVWYLLAFNLMAVRKRRAIDRDTLRIIWGLFCHFPPVFSQVFVDSEAEAGCSTHVSPARFINAQTELSLDDIAGQSRTLIPFVWRKVRVNYAVCASIVLLENKPITLAMLLHN